jgi:hypothetical protein
VGDAAFANGKVLREAGRVAEAVDVPRQFLANQPSHLEVRRWLADSLLAQGNGRHPQREDADWQSRWCRAFPGLSPTGLLRPSGLAMTGSRQFLASEAKQCRSDLTSLDRHCFAAFAMTRGRAKRRAPRPVPDRARYGRCTSSIA